MMILVAFKSFLEFALLENLYCTTENFVTCLQSMNYYCIRFHGVRRSLPAYIINHVWGISEGKYKVLRTGKLIIMKQKYLATVATIRREWRRKNVLYATMMHDIPYYLLIQTHRPFKEAR